MFKSFWKITVTQTQKSNCKQNHPKLDYTAQLLSTQKVITVPMFKVDVESVLHSYRYTFTVTSTTDWQLYQWWSDQIDAIPQLVVLSNGRRHRSGNGRLALAKSSRSHKFILFINTALNHARRKRRASAG